MAAAGCSSGESSSCASSNADEMEEKVRKFKFFKIISLPLIRCVFKALYSDEAREFCRGDMSLEQWIQLKEKEQEILPPKPLGTRKGKGKKKVEKTFRETTEDFFKGTRDNFPELFTAKLLEVPLDFTFYNSAINYWFKSEKEQFFPGLKEISLARNKLLHSVRSDKGLTIVELEAKCCEVMNKLKELHPTSKYVEEAVAEITQNLKLLDGSFDDGHLNLEDDCREDLSHLLLNLEKSSVYDWLQTEGVSNKLKESSVFDVYVAPELTRTNGEVNHVGDLFPTAEDSRVSHLPKIVFLSGSTGMGKTTFVRHIVQQWISKSSSPNLLAFQLVFLVDLSRTEFTDIYQYLRQEMPLLMDSIGKDLFVPLLSENNMLFVIDGLDERFPKRRQLLQNIANTFPTSSLMITTERDGFRPTRELFPESKIPIEVVKIGGFDSGRCCHFVSKVCDQTGGNVELGNKLRNNFSELRKQRDVFSDQLRSPLEVTLFMMLFLLLEDAPESEVTNLIVRSTTLTRLWLGLSSFMREKLSHEKNLNASVQRFQHNLGRVALDKVPLGSILLLTAQEMSKLSEGLTGIETYLNETLMPRFLFKQNDDIGEFSFYHETQIHYLAAEFVVNEGIPDYIFQLPKLSHCKYKEVMRSLVGCAAIKNVDVDMVKLSDLANGIGEMGYEDCYHFWYKMISETESTDETGKRSYNEILCSKINALLRPSWNMHVSNITGMVGLLKCYPTISINHLSINMKGAPDPSGTLINLLQRLTCALGTLDDENKIPLSLYFEDCFVHGEWYSYIESWGKVVKVEGQLPSAALISLQRCSHLQELTLEGVSSVEDFNEIVHICVESQELQQVKLTLSFIGHYEEDQKLSQFHVRNEEDSSENDLPFSLHLIINEVSTALLPTTISVLRQILPRNNRFNKIWLRKAALVFSDAQKLQRDLSFFTDGELQVDCPLLKLSIQEAARLRQEPFKDYTDGLHKWPYFQFLWNGMNV